MIHSILTNPTYTGDLAQGRSRVKSYKVHQIESCSTRGMGGSGWNA